MVKSECETCQLVVPVLAQLQERVDSLRVYFQDDGAFLAELNDVLDDTELERSFRLAIQTVPTLVRLKAGEEEGRVVGWNRAEWEGLTGVDGLGPGLLERHPGCGSRSVEPGVSEALRVRYGHTGIRSRPVGVGPLQDAIEICYDRGWSDGLPVVPPTPERILRVLAGTRRDPGEVIGLMPPDLVECTVEKGPWCMAPDGRFMVTRKP